MNGLNNETNTTTIQSNSMANIREEVSPSISSLWVHSDNMTASALNRINSSCWNELLQVL